MRGETSRKEVTMVRTTVGKIGKQLEELAESHLPLEASLRMVERKASTVEELVVIEVMKEVILEMCVREHVSAA